MITLTIQHINERAIARAFRRGRSARADRSCGKDFYAGIWRTLLLGSLAMFLGAVATVRAQTSQPVPKEMAQALLMEQQAAAKAAEGRAAEAEALYRESLTVAERVMPADSPVLAGSFNNVGQFYQGQKRFAEAAQFFN